MGGNGGPGFCVSACVGMFSTKTAQNVLKYPSKTRNLVKKY